jgi:hypothetical protein
MTTKKATVRSAPSTPTAPEIREELVERPAPDIHLLRFGSGGHRPSSVHIDVPPTSADISLP